MLLKIGSYKKLLKLIVLLENLRYCTHGFDFVVFTEWYFSKLAHCMSEKCRGWSKESFCISADEDDAGKYTWG